MRCVKFISAAVLAVSVVFFCACFSLGVEDMAEYNTRFPYVYSVEWDFSSTKTEMKDFVGEDEDSSGSASGSDSGSASSASADKSELVAVVTSKAYRAVAVEVDSGDSSKYPTSTVSELAMYLYYECADGEEATLNYGVFVSSSLPQDSQSTYTLSDITGSSSSDLYEDGSIVTPFTSSSMLAKDSVVLENGWSSIYVTFGNTTVKDGEYVVIVFYENNDYTVSVTEVVDTTNSTNDTTYTYTFTQYTDNDIAFSFDKVLLYVSEDDSSTS